jgi:hypothetical protein
MVEIVQEPEHSPKGGSSAERWINCPGSGVILKQLELPQSEEQDYRRDGVAAHEAAGHCLTEQIDSWEVIGQKFHGVAVDKNMAEAVQTYLDYCRSLMLPDATIMIEAPIGEDPVLRPHPQFWGRVDFSQYATDVIDVVDYKHGEGIVVEPDENAQMLYYAYGIIYPRIQRGVLVRSDRLVRLHIVQPRAYHEDGPTRMWETTVGEVIHWGESVLVPAMNRAEFDTTLEAGSWCRFCPAKLFCPLMASIYGAAAKADASVLASFSQQRLALDYAVLPQVKMIAKAIEEEVFRRNNLGNTVPGTKLVLKRSFRIWNSEAPEALEVLGDERFTPIELKSPAEMEKLGPAAKALVKEYAFMPNNGLTVAPENDKKPGVKVEKAVDVFAHLIPTATNGDQSDTSKS